jgi:hypothetical protein
MRYRFRSLLLSSIVAAVALGVMSGSAFAGGPVWSITAVSAPRVFAPGDSSGNDQIILTVANIGSGPSNGSKLSISDVLPKGLIPTSIAGIVGTFDQNPEGILCTLSSLTCTYTGTVLPYELLEVKINVDVGASAPTTLINKVSVGGGGAASKSISQSVNVNNIPAGFGIEQFDLSATNEDGSPDTQAGSHPYQVTATFGLNQQAGLVEDLSGGLGPAPLPVTPAKDLQFELPPGLLGNPTAFPQCTAKQFTTQIKYGEGGALRSPSNFCPASTAIGVARVTLTISEGNYYQFVSPMFNLVPNVGEPARFGFTVNSIPVYLDTSVRTGGNYGVTVNVNNIPQVVGFDASQVNFWGNPGDPSHDASRGWACLLDGAVEYSHINTCPVSSGGAGAQPPPPFLILPTSCTGPLSTTMKADSWREPGIFTSIASVTHDGAGNPIGLTGCNKLDFRPSISVAPDGQASNTPTGLGVGVHVDQEESLVPSGLAESTVRRTTVTLPEGVQLSPGAADGLSACTTSEIGLGEEGEPTCPDSSKVATVQIKSPLLPNPLEGEAYLGSQDENPFGSLIALYIVAKDPVSGVLVKVAGQVVPNAVTGQLVSTFSNVPQLPFEDLKLNFFGTARAPLSTPSLCGSYTTSASIEPWSGQESATPSSTFQITSGPNGTPCANPLPFGPGFTAGTTSNQAGGFSPFTLTMTRPDQDQTLSGIQVHMPPGLLGTLSTVKLCEEPQASQGTCGPESLIGHTTVSAGLGGDPYTVQGGRVYITTGYKGAPFGLSIVNPAVAGPFNLGIVIVRAAINVDPTTAALTITSDPLPTIIDGIPLQIQHVNVNIDRPNFTFNSTDCNPMKISATLSSSSGQSSTGSSPFQVTNCAALAFKPKLTATVSGRTSRANGASLDVKLSYPAGPYDANIAKVKVDLPRQLPSELKTLQQACPAATFEANPALCSAGSRVGIAKATTPVLPVPLTGPAYFVSHGGEEFPSLIVVLQGYGVRVDLVGSTFISKAGITSSTFKSIPDVPVGTFELYLPQGKYSALGANGNLCKSKLNMPTAFEAQNGVVLHQTTKISVTNCPKAKPAKKKKTKAKKANNAQNIRPAHAAHRRSK